MERIEINGVWYVRENSVKSKPKFEDTIEIDAIHYEALLFETDDYVFDVSRMYRDDDETFFDSLAVKFTDKRNANRDMWNEEFWDNDNFLLGVLNDDEESLSSARESLCSRGIAELKFVVKQLIERGWLKNNK